MKHTFASFAAAVFYTGISLWTACARAEPLAGTWEWVSVEATMPDGRKMQPFGSKPQGLVILDNSGRFSWLIARPGRQKFAANRRDLGTPEENQAAVHGSLSYSGMRSMAIS